MIPEQTPVEIQDGEFEGHTAVVLNTAGQTTTSGSSIPDGWVELVFDPHDSGGYYTELYQEEQVSIVGC